MEYMSAMIIVMKIRISVVRRMIQGVTFIKTHRRRIINLFFYDLGGPPEGLHLKTYPSDQNIKQGKAFFFHKDKMFSLRLCYWESWI